MRHLRMQGILSVRAGYRAVSLPNRRLFGRESAVTHTSISRRNRYRYEKERAVTQVSDANLCFMMLSCNARHAHTLTLFHPDTPTHTHAHAHTYVHTNIHIHVTISGASAQTSRCTSSTGRCITAPPGSTPPPPPPDFERRGICRLNPEASLWLHRAARK